MKTLRIILALAFFLGISLLLTGLVPEAVRWLGWMPEMQFLPAVMALNTAIIIFLILITICFGRIYCSSICPLGVMQDGVFRVSVLTKRIRRKRKPFHYRKEHKWLRYGIWVVFVAALIAGIQPIVALLAPYSAYGRIVSSVFHFHKGPVLIAAGATLVLVVLLAWFTGREYCNSICPVGTTLSFFSRFALFRPVIDADKCRNCHICENNCKASCIDIANHWIDYSRCVDCFDCLGDCKFDALKYRFFFKKAHASEEAVPFPQADHCVAPPSQAGPLEGKEYGAPENVSFLGCRPRADMASGEGRASSNQGRRAFLAGTAMFLGATALKAQSKKTDGGFATVLPKQPLKRTTPVTPPGSKSVKDFYKRCTACQLCISLCPNNVLRPSTDLEHLMQPEMGFENGYCRPECTSCSQVCPSGAIIKITPEEKTQYHIGTASVDRSLCVTERGVKCGNCARHCPVGAINMVRDEERGISIPVVDEAVCIGCGACENLCPSRPVSAITVNGRHNHLDI